MTPDFKPSQVRLGIPPLVGTMGNAECEHAACMLVRACQVSGDTWATHTPRSLFASIEPDIEADIEPLGPLMRNPFFTPDFGLLVAGGFATFADPDSPVSPIEFTDKGFEALRPYVARLDDDWTACPNCDAPTRFCECFKGAPAMIDETATLKALVQELLAATLRDKEAVDHGDDGNAYELLAIFAKYRDNPVRFEGGNVRITGTSGWVTTDVPIGSLPHPLVQEAEWRKLFERLP